MSIEVKEPCNVSGMDLQIVVELRSRRLKVTNEDQVSFKVGGF